MTEKSKVCLIAIAIYTLKRRRVQASLVTVADQLMRFGMLSKMGGLTWLVAFFDRVYEHTEERSYWKCVNG